MQISQWQMNEILRQNNKVILMRKDDLYSSQTLLDDFFTFIML